MNCSGNCLLVLPPQKEYQFHVVTSNETLGTRHINKIEAIKAKGAQIFLFQQFSVIVKPNVDFKEIELTNNDADNTAVLLSTNSPGVSAQALDQGKLVGNPTDLTVSDFLTEKKRFTLNFKVDKTNGSTFDFEQLLVTRNCSYPVTLTDKPIELKTVDKNSVLSRVTHTCVYLVSASEGNLEVDSLDLKSKSEYDTIQVKDGLKLTAKSLISSSSQQAAAHLADFDSRISSTNSLMVILTSNFASTPQYEQGSVTIKKSAFTVITKPTDKVSITTDHVYIFKFDDTLGYPYLTFDKTFKLTSELLTIHDREFGEPIFTYKKDELVFNELWSETKVLVLNFTATAGVKADTLNAKLDSRPVSCSRMVYSPSSLVLNGSEALINQNCSFYFKPESSFYPVALQLQNVRLTEGACLQLQALSDVERQMFNLCRDKEDIVQQNVPDFILWSNYSYVLTYQNKQTYKKDIMLQAAFSYHAVDRLRIFNLTQDTPAINVSSFDYPNNYPYYLEDGVSGIDQITSDTRYLAVSFEKYNLRTGDVLNVIGENPKWTGNRPDDFVHAAEQKENQSSLLLSFRTKFDASLKTLLTNEHAQGFKVAFERFACILNATTTKDGGIWQTPGYPSKFVNATKCIAIIDLAEDQKYLNLTVDNGKENLGFGVLTVFDDASRQRSNLAKVFDQNVLKNNQTFSFNASSTKLVILFDPLKETTVNGFQITIKKESE